MFWDEARGVSGDHPTEGATLPLQEAAVCGICSQGDAGSHSVLCLQCSAQHGGQGFFFHGCLLVFRELCQGRSVAQPHSWVKLHTVANYSPVLLFPFTLWKVPCAWSQLNSSSSVSLKSVLQISLGSLRAFSQLQVRDNSSSGRFLTQSLKSGCSWGSLWCEQLRKQVLVTFILN